MKFFLLSLLILTSFSSFAEDYSCQIQVSQDGTVLETINLKQGFGATSSNALFTVPVSRKKNLIGKVVEEVNVVFSGLIMSDGTLEGSSVKGEISLDTTTIRKQIRTDRKRIVRVDGKGYVDVTGSDSGITVDGFCDTRF